VFPLEGSVSATGNRHADKPQPVERVSLRLLLDDVLSSRRGDLGVGRPVTPHPLDHMTHAVHLELGRAGQDETDAVAGARGLEFAGGCATPEGCRDDFRAAPKARRFRDSGSMIGTAASAVAAAASIVKLGPTASPRRTREAWAGAWGHTVRGLEVEPAFEATSKRAGGAASTAPHEQAQRRRCGHSARAASMAPRLAREQAWAGYPPRPRGERPGDPGRPSSAFLDGAGLHQSPRGGPRAARAAEGVQEAKLGPARALTLPRSRGWAGYAWAKRPSLPRPV
jgi:hypothetical protein